VTFTIPYKCRPSDDNRHALMIGNVTSKITRRQPCTTCVQLLDGDTEYRKKCCGEVGCSSQSTQSSFLIYTTIDNRKRR
jgi:hypothetical protein